MTRSILLMLILATCAGITAAWLAIYVERAEDPPRSVGAGADVVKRFPLLPADAALERETPAVAVDSAGRVLLAWASRTSDSDNTLWLARSKDGGSTFAKPVAFRTIPVKRYASKMKGKTITRATSVVPRLAAANGTIFLAWTEPGPSGVAYYLAKTTDGGKSFSQPAPAHGDLAERPGFTGLWAGPAGDVACAWLDHRHERQLPFCSVAPLGKTFQTEQLAYAGAESRGVCPCCDTAVLCTPDGTTVVAFRNNDGDNRDICIARSRVGSSAGFEPPVTVNEHWRFPGCPHDGPALALAGDRLHVVWMDGHSGAQRVYHASSGLALLQFTPRELNPTAAGDQGHPKIAAAGTTLHAVWDAGSGASSATHQHDRPADAERTVMYASARNDGGFAAAVPIARRSGTVQVNPALAIAPTGQVCVVWNEFTAVSKTVVFARLPPR